MKHNQLNRVNIVMPGSSDNLEAVVEGLLLSTYQFNKYKTDKRIDNLNLIEQNFKPKTYCKSFEK